MANVEKLEDKLLKLTDTDESFAIALTGEWGIGKTHFWKEFYKKNHKDLGVSKYSYVSLFGIDSIDALKFEIALSTHDTTQKKDYLTGLKGIFKKGLDAIDLPKLEGTGVTLSLGKGLISSAITSLIGDTLICIDDIERLSKNLDIKDVMGLVNHLSLEKNCKVVVILHEGKADKDFREYKEKVFDEVLVLDDSLLIIEHLISDIETFPIYEKFYQTIGVRNLRFYQRVQKIYHEIIKRSSSLSKLSKEEILKQVLIIKAVYDMPDLLGIDMKLFQTYFSDLHLDERIEARRFGSEEEKARLNDKIDKAKRIIEKFHKNFRLESWANIVIDALTDLSIDEIRFGELIERDHLEHTRLDIERRIFDLNVEFRSLVPKADYNQRLFQTVKDGIYTQNLNSLSRYCKILKHNGETALADELINLVKDFIQAKVSQDASNYNESYWYPSGVDGDDIFYDYLGDISLSYSSNVDNKNKHHRLFDDYFHNKTYDDKNFDLSLLNINKSELRGILWKPLSDERDRKSYIAHVISYPAFRHHIISLNIVEDWNTLSWNYSNRYISPISTFDNLIYIIKKDILRQWTLELLKEKIEENPNSRAPIEMWLKTTDNLNYI